jgi:hypothetical protein
LSASVSGANPVQPDMPSASLVSCAFAVKVKPAAQTPVASSDAILTADLIIPISYYGYRLKTHEPTKSVLNVPGVSCSLIRDHFLPESSIYRFILHANRNPHALYGIAAAH